MSLIDKRVLFVTGKGGTGKTTVATSIGMWAARSGKKSLIVECNGTQHVGPLFDAPGSTYEPTEIHPGLHAMTITSAEAIEDYIVQQIKIRSLYKLVFRNRIMAPFMDAVPGLHDSVHLGKVFDLSRQTDARGQPTWDLIIVDAPATGHGLNLLASPKSMMDMTQRGPIFDGVRSVQEIIADVEKTGIVLTCLPEDMPVSETIDLYGSLGRHQHQVLACVLNQMDETPIPEASNWDAAKTRLLETADEHVHEALKWAERCRLRQRDQTHAQDSLHRMLSGIPVIPLPFLLKAELKPEDFTALSGRMEAGGQIT